jgi:hypothetical protein
METANDMPRIKERGFILPPIISEMLSCETSQRRGPRA